MTYDMLLLRFGEFTLKGKNRNRFEKSVLNHIRNVLKPYPGAKILKEYGRLYIELNGEPPEILIHALKKVFGLVSISPVRVCPSELDPIIATAVEFVGQKELTDTTTFKVNARRVWKQFPHSSQEMNHLVGSPLLRTYPQLKVKVKKPDIELRVEIRENETYLYYEVIPGAGGYPLGTNGKAMLLLSGGIDSPVAGWSAMRRGLEIECVHFYSFPYTSQLAKEKVMELTRLLSGYTGKIKLHLVPFTDVQTSFVGIGQDNLIITFMRRAMLRIASSLAEREGALAIVTGDSLGQVASQTLPSMNVIGRATELPLLRPLVMMDKNDIINIAMDIGTFETSILPYEDCCTLFVPKSPTTNPNLNIIEKVEASLTRLPALLQAAVEGTETVIITPDSKIGTMAEKNEEFTVNEDWF
ncbi:tRNA 4-thiouridine(8) synthase ThiI [Paenibacillus glucanolyticus]|jgi:thiamine biosynthesis protein ThiI|uniref:tRNA uracil 4-sulfurtransferase ThiI n=1 Tax=Paenibacillus TaxID=44249 RepID=UPI0003E2B847|nr:MULTISPECIES: tRNA uracil 4-sulfurtransferase ThiI [Paenibacillus]ANA81649.1 tRNA 4-thiouridine(8) synthase ThiI [Paenibacillus glucanolyticus]AVV59617.1 tRNA 4-thiouridine(8) synthase ThiI [Paenibacillus glucanolyticus]AWP28874.1 tRNA 4-thiouridine(8) synthase ThiI [Paenibacillus sp. Cedars]ETT30312.1 thiamine biosynthesis/tRNA modification protein ThiI [Paenibacillus sp. FSL R5-808]OMF74100.1 tRNA 4-thiouridine(8) synthase ThiI [Paenibacillus glucanolyticus]